MNTLSERMEIALAHAKGSDPHKSKSGLAKACGIRPASVTDWFNGRTKTLSYENAVRAAAYLHVNAKWLASGSEEMLSPSVGAFSPYSELEEGFVEIPEYSVRFSAGPGNMVIEPVEGAAKARYRESWFQERQINPENCKRFKVHGDSMEPFLWDGDTILVDCAPQEIVSGKVYAFSLYGEMRVKILRPLMRGIQVKSLNPDFPDEVLMPEDLETFRLIGRVRDRSGDSKL